MIIMSRKRRVRRGGGVKHLKQAVNKRIKEGVHRIGRHILNRKLGETFLIPSLRPTYSTTNQLIESSNKP